VQQVGVKFYITQYYFEALYIARLQKLKVYLLSDRISTEIIPS